MMGITYLADFSANLCRDAGYYAIAGQIDFFGKAAVMTLGVPVVVSLLETIQGVLS
jgi:stage III sporulation protein AD